MGNLRDATARLPWDNTGHVEALPDSDLAAPANGGQGESTRTSTGAKLRRTTLDEAERATLASDLETTTMNSPGFSPLAPLFRVCDGVRVRFADNKADSSAVTVLMLSPCHAEGFAGVEPHQPD